MRARYPTYNGNIIMIIKAGHKVFAIVAAPRYDGLECHGIASLPGAQSDARRIEKALRTSCAKILPHGVVSTSSGTLTASTLNDLVLSEIDRAASYKKNHCDTRVTFLLFLAGHGSRTFNADCLEKYELGSDEGFLLPGNFSVWSDDAFGKAVARCIAASVTMVAILDTCYSGGFIGDARRVIESVSDHAFLQQRNMSGRLWPEPDGGTSVKVIASAHEDELAFETQDGTRFARIIEAAILEDYTLEQLSERVTTEGGACATYTIRKRIPN